MESSSVSRSLRTLELGLAVLYALGIFVVGSLRNTPPAAREVSDKLQHGLGFALLALLWCRALQRVRPSWSLPAVVSTAFLLSVALGGALELWQGWLGYRSCELLDWIADALGAAAAASLYAGFEVWRRARPGATP
jgi:VanZ family protein